MGILINNGLWVGVQKGSKLIRFPLWSTNNVDGNVFLTALQKNFVSSFDTNTTELFGNFTDTLKWFGGVLAPNGKIYCVPVNSTQGLAIGSPQNVDVNAVLSRYLNKL